MGTRTSWMKALCSIKLTSVADFRRFLSQLFGAFLSKDSKVCLISDMCRFFAVSCQPLAK